MTYPLCVADQFLCDRIAGIEAQIIAYEDAVAALNGGVQSYMLDTGQTTQRVTRTDVLDLQKAIDSLYNRRDVLRVRCGLEKGSHTATPGF